MMQTVKRYWVLWVAVMLSLISASSVGFGLHDPKVIQKLPFSDFDKPVLLTADTPMLILKLHSNPTTGYRWYLMHYDRHYLVAESAKFYPPVTKRIGASGYEVWQFRVKRGILVPQITKIEMVYARPWKLDHAQAKTVTLIITPR